MAVTGLDGYSGVVFSDITRGETLPFTFQFMEEDQVTPIDVTGWKVYLAFSGTRDCSDAAVLALEVEILPQTPLEGILSKNITDDETFALPTGKLFASARYIKPDGSTYIIDKAKLKVYPCINPRRA